MDVYFTNTADRELKNWLKSDRATAKKIYELISDIQKFGMLGDKGVFVKMKIHQKSAKNTAVS